MGAFHLALGLGLDLLSQLHNLDFLVQDAQHDAHLRRSTVLTEDLHALLHVHWQAAGNQIGELQGGAGVQRHLGHFGGSLAVEFGIFPVPSAQEPHQRRHFLSFLNRFRLGLHLRPQVRVQLAPGSDSDPVQCPYQHAQDAVRRPHHLVDDRDHTDTGNFVRAGFLVLGPGGHQHNMALGGHVVADDAQAAGLPHGQGYPHVRIHNQTLKGNDRQILQVVRLPLRHFGVSQIPDLVRFIQNLFLIRVAVYPFVIHLGTVYLLHQAGGFCLGKASLAQGFAAKPASGEP